VNNPSDVQIQIDQLLVRMMSLHREVRGMRLMIIDLSASEKADLDGQEEALKAAIAILDYKERESGT